ncbi:hypothetical protein [Thermofilum pendens]|uniref:Uncharacterized protein n=1 Tax=Thermofilum pendens (strain DSM 2475 / Hrk 5) TaxID=368408 RepID=A1S1B1_THEPD|nr:hypothetical protein [Thermofilum pendens]ABL79241.1 hypothetical protein Tpen_1846 [Thermofilum pendens Hrk 5]
MNRKASVPMLGGCIVVHQVYPPSKSVGGKGEAVYFLKCPGGFVEVHEHVTVIRPKGEEEFGYVFRSETEGWYGPGARVLSWVPLWHYLDDITDGKFKKKVHTPEELYSLVEEAYAQWEAEVGV